MADKLGFSHITVTADEDEDIVIQAGVVDEPSAKEPSVSAPAPEAAPAADGGAEAAEGDTADGGAEAADIAPEPPARSRPAAPDDGYRETTLEDIESAKMSGTQKAVILVAMLGIAAFVLWYLLAG